MRQAIEHRTYITGPYGSFAPHKWLYYPDTGEVEYLQPDSVSPGEVEPLTDEWFKQQIGAVTIVEIPQGSGNRYRYGYNKASGKTIYLGPVGSVPMLSEEEFLRGLGREQLPIQKLAWVWEKVKRAEETSHMGQLMPIWELRELAEEEKDMSHEEFNRLMFDMSREGWLTFQHLGPGYYKDNLFAPHIDDSLGSREKGVLYWLMWMPREKGYRGPVHPNLVINHPDEYPEAAERIRGYRKRGKD